MPKHSLARPFGEAIAVGERIPKEWPTAIRGHQRFFLRIYLLPRCLSDAARELSGLIEKLGTDADKMNWVFVSVD